MYLIHSVPHVLALKRRRSTTSGSPFPYHLFMNFHQDPSSPTSSNHECFSLFSLTLTEDVSQFWAPVSFPWQLFDNYVWSERSKLDAGFKILAQCRVIQTLIFMFSILFCFPFLTTPKTKFPFPGLAWNWSNPQILFPSRRSQSNTSTEHRILLLFFCLYALPFIFCIGV